MPSGEKFKRKFRFMHEKYDDCWMYGICLCIDWPNHDGTRDKYIAIRFGVYNIMIGWISQYEESEGGK